MTLSVLLAVLISAAHATTPAPLPSLAVERHVLPNGLTVLLREDHSTPVVAVNIWYKVGSKNEETGRTGFAHLFEHYMFEGSQNVPGGGYFKEIFGMGGQVNATTNYDRTDYYAVVPSENLEEVLRLESDRMAYLNINQAGLDKQRPIVKNEKRMRGNSPYAGVGEKLGDTIWDQGHPYKWPIIGSMQDLDAASLHDIKTFHDRYYLPNNAIIVVNGDQHSARTLALIEKWFGPIPAGPTPPALRVPASGPLTSPRSSVLDDPKAQLPMLILAFRIPGHGKPGWQEAEVAASILGDGRTSRLVQKLKYEQSMVLEISAEVEGLQENDVLMIQAVPAPGVPLDRVEEAIRAEIDAFIQGGPTEQEMHRVKAGLRASGLSALQDANSLAAAIAKGEGFHGDPDYVITQLNKVGRMDASAPQAAARQFLAPSSVNKIVVRPNHAVPAPQNGGRRD